MYNSDAPNKDYIRDFSTARMQRFFNYIASRRFAIYLLIFTTLIILVSSLLPNVTYLSEAESARLQLERPLLYEIAVKWGVVSLVKTPFFQIVPIFLFLSIGVCTIRRLLVNIRGKEDVGKGEKITTAHSIPVKDDGAIVATLLILLKKNGWRAESSKEKSYIINAVKGEKGIWGSFLFHLGMNIVLVGVSISALTGLRGGVKLTEGFTHSIPNEISGIPDKYKDEFPIKSIKLESFDAEIVEGQFPTDFTSHILIEDQHGDIRQHKLKVNHPLRVSGYDIIFGKGGFAPRLILKGQDGNDIIDAVVNMQLSVPGVVDTLSITGEGLEIHVQLFPDYFKVGNKHGTRGEYPLNPYLYVEIERWDKKIGNGFLKPGTPVRFDRYSIEFRELHHWVDIIITRDWGVKVLFLGFLIVILGLLYRFVVNEKRLWFLVEKKDGETELKIGGRGSYFPSLFEEELVGLLEIIRSELDIDKKTGRT